MTSYMYLTSLKKARCVYIYACIYLYMYACICHGMFVRMYVCMYVASFESGTAIAMEHATRILVP
jgi:hypothetical protein